MKPLLQRDSKILLSILKDLAKDISEDDLLELCLDKVADAYPTVDITTSFGEEFILNAQERIYDLITEE